MTDSNSGITQDKAKELDISVVPMPFMINDETYFEDINLSRQEFYTRLEQGADIITSQPSPEALLKLWDSLLKEYDEVVHIPMSSGLSGSCETAHMLSLDYDGKVQVVNNQRISVTQIQSVMNAIHLSHQGKTAQEIKTILEQDKHNSSIYIMLDTLFYLKKGGRITPAAAALGTILKLKPVLQIQGDKLDAFAKARTISQAKSIMMNAIKNDVSGRFATAIDHHDLTLYIAHTENDEAAIILREELLQSFPQYTIAIHHLPLSIACHLGPGALAIACTKDLKI